MHRRLSTLLLILIVTLLFSSLIVKGSCDLLASWNFSSDTIETVPSGWTEDHPSNNFFRAKLDGVNMIANVNHTSGNATTSVNWSSFSAISTSNTSTINFDYCPNITNTYDYIIIHKASAHVNEGIFLSFHTNKFYYYSAGAWQQILASITVGAWLHIYIYNIDFSVGTGRFDLNVNGTKYVTRGGFAASQTSLGYINLEGGGGETTRDLFDNIVITNNIVWHDVKFNYMLQIKQYSNIMANYQLHTEQYSNILSNFMLHTEQFSNIISNFMLQTKGFHDVLSNFMLQCLGLSWHNIVFEILFYGNTTLFTGGLLDENFILLIILMLVCIALCIKRIPLIGFIFGFITFFLCVSNLVFDTNIPSNPTISILVALIGVITIILNTLKFRERK